MKRSFYSAIFAFSLATLSFTTVGCGSGENEVLEDTRSEAEITQEMEDYDAEMEAQDDVSE